MDGKHVVWVYNDRVYASGTEYRTVPKHEWEASPYGNVHKYAHDVYPAKSALGINGCTDCHHPSSDFFFASTTKYPFDAQGKPVTEPQCCLIGVSTFWATVGAWREAYVKPVLYGLLVALVCALVALAGELHLAWVFADHPIRPRLRVIPWAAALAIAVAAIALAQQPDLMGYMFPTRFTLDANHALLAGGVFVAGIVALLCEVGIHRPPMKGRQRRAGVSRAAICLVVALGLAAASGLLMLLKVPGLDALTRASYTVFDVSLVLVLAVTVFAALRRAVRPQAALAHEES
jgi:hypothetical protein